MNRPLPDYRCDQCKLPIAKRLYGGFLDGQFRYLCRQCHASQVLDRITDARGETVRRDGCESVEARAG